MPHYKGVMLARASATASGSQIVQLVRCSCGNFVELIGEEKVACGRCGQVFGSFSDYCRMRTKQASSEGDGSVIECT